MAEIKTFLSPKAEKQVNQFLKDLGLMRSGYSDLEKAMQGATDVFMKQTKAAKEVDTTLKKTQKTKKEITAAEKETIRIQKALATTQAKLDQAYTTEAQKLDKKKAKLQEVNKENRAYAKEQLEINKRLKEGQKDAVKITGSYAALSKRLGEQRKLAKDLAATYGTGSKQFKEAAKEVNRLDKELKEIDNSVGQNQRSVGNYWGAFKEGIVSTGRALIANPIGAIIAVAVAAFKGLQAIISRNSAASDKFQQIWGGISQVFQVVIGRITKLAGAAVKLIKGDFTGAFDQAKGAVSGLKEEMENAYKSGQALIRLQQRIRDQETQNITVLQKLNNELAIYQQRAGDATISLEEQQAAAQKAASLQIELLETELRLANQRTTAAAIARKQAAQTAGDTVAAELAIQEAQAESIRIAGELRLAREEAATLSRQITQDQLEQELDYLIDFYDKQKTINEQRIKDDTLSFQERQAILDETIKLGEQSFDDQVKILQDAATGYLDINELIQESDARVGLERAKQAGLSEVLAKRLLEVINERKLAINDLDLAQKDLNKEFTRGVEGQVQTLDRANNQKIKLERELTKETLKESKVRKVNVEQDEEDIAAIREKSLQFAIDGVNALFDIGKAKRGEEIQEIEANAQAEIEALEKQREQGILTEEQYNAKRAKIDRELEQKQKEARIKDAKAQKAQGIFSIAINTAKAIVAALPNLALSIIIGSIGAIQAAVVAATPLPKFAKGTKSSPEGLAEVGEQGRELLIFPSGESMIAEHSYQYLPKGTEVKTNYQTEQILSAGYDSPEVQWKELGNKLDNINHTIKNKRELTINARKGTIADRGNEYYNRYFKRLMQ